MSALNIGLGSGSSSAGKQEDNHECEESSSLADFVSLDDRGLEMSKGES